jgi:hypothetical protein
MVIDDVRANLRYQLYNHVGIQTPDWYYQNIYRVKVFWKKMTLLLGLLMETEDEAIHTARTKMSTKLHFPKVFIHWRVDP